MNEVLRSASVGALGASKLVCVFAFRQKTVQWTVLREAREKRIPYGVRTPTKKNAYVVRYAFEVALNVYRLDKVEAISLSACKSDKP